MTETAFKCPGAAAIREYIKAHPGSLAREVAAGLGVPSEKGLRAVGRHISQMLRFQKPHLRREGTKQPHRYYFIRHPERVTVEHTRERSRRNKERYRREKGALPRAQHLAAVKQPKVPRAARPPMTDAERMEKQRAKSERHRRKVGARTWDEWLAELASRRVDKPTPKPRTRMSPEERNKRKRECDERRAREQGVRTRAEYLADLAKRAKPAKNRKPEAQQPARLFAVKDRETVFAREVATAPVKPALPDSSTWTGPVEVIPPGVVSKASALRHNHRRAA